tara:strand:- start:275 stop:1792 length:1518 start_codon:yes stop_codon:yes gene_type:complete
MFRIFGPPGTGKTTTLLNMVDDALERGVPSNTIAFLAFTRKAANEAKERAVERFKLDPKNDLPYFRTLHSLALQMSDIQKDQIMQPENYKELSHSMGVALQTQTKTDFSEDITDLSSNSDPILGLINLARLRKVDLREQYNESRIEYDWNTVNYVDKCLKEYKKSYHLFDFTDMLDAFIQNAEENCPRFSLTFLDEAQDLSPLQWDIAHILDAKSQKMYAAGDDDQAIYRWAGADVDAFINLDGSSETLSQSHRVPKSIHFLAEKVARRIHRRFPKKYKARDTLGLVSRIDSVNSITMDDGSWLIMSQAGYTLNPVTADLRGLGYLFTYRGHRSISTSITTAVNGWNRLREGDEVSGEVAKKIYSYMSLNTRVKRGFKKLTGILDDEFMTLSVLQERCGLLATENMEWFDAMDKLPELDRAYILKLLRKGEDFNKPPRITVSTIHGAKGGEADNVVLFTDLSPAAEEDMRINPDDMHRVFYVGVTRTKDKLYIVDAEQADRSYDL